MSRTEICNKINLKLYFAIFFPRVWKKTGPESLNWAEHETLCSPDMSPLRFGTSVLVLASSPQTAGMWTLRPVSPAAASVCKCSSDSLRPCCIFHVTSWNVPQHAPPLIHANVSALQPCILKTWTWAPAVLCGRLGWPRAAICKCHRPSVYFWGKQRGRRPLPPALTAV